MNLFRALKENDHAWSVGPGVNTGGVRMTMTNPNGNSVSKEVNLYNLEKGRNPFDVLAVNCLRAMEPRPEILEKWFDYHGNFKARVIPGVELDGPSIYYGTHVALRKLLDGGESVILWNGYHALDKETSDLYMEFLKDFFSGVASKEEPGVVNLRTFSMEFRDSAVAFFEDRAHALRRGSSIPEDQVQIHLALLYSMAHAFKNLSGDDYVYGFFGYIFERFPDE